MSTVITQLNAELEALAKAHNLEITTSFSAWELSPPADDRQRTFNYSTVRKYKLDTVCDHYLLINFEDKNGEYNGMVLVGNLRRAIAMLNSNDPLFDTCDGCDSCEMAQ